MVSSPFGGVDGIQEELFSGVLHNLDIDLKKKAVLDVGCGRGYAEKVVVEAGGNYVGMDFVVSRRGFRLVQGDAARLPFEEASFDVVMCVDASEHFPEPEQVAKELYRVLRPGGVFFLSAPNYGNVAGLVKVWCERWGRYAKNTWAPFGRWQAQEFEQALTMGWVRRLYSQAGFSQLKGIGYPAEVGLGLCPWMDHPKTPEAIQFRLQRLFRFLGPALVRMWPGSSLHVFWRMEK